MRLIDADALKRTKITLEDGCSIVDAARAIIRAVDLAPTIDPESLRPKGEWLYKDIKYDGVIYYEATCSHCDWRGRFFKKDSCPNCGADMRGADS